MYNGGDVRNRNRERDQTRESGIFLEKQKFISSFEKKKKKSYGNP